MFTKSTFILLAVALMSASAYSQIVHKTDKVNDLYSGIEFQMPRVQEPIIPANTVSITDFGAQRAVSFSVPRHLRMRSQPFQKKVAAG